MLWLHAKCVEKHFIDITQTPQQLWKGVSSWFTNEESNDLNLPMLGERCVLTQLFLTQTHARIPSGILSSWFLSIPSFLSKLAFLSHVPPLKEVMLILVSACYSYSSPLGNVILCWAWLKSSFPCETFSDYSKAQCSLGKPEFANQSVEYC